jgi:hypothetical protein
MVYRVSVNTYCIYKRIVLSFKERAMEIRWNKLKSERLKQVRGVSFEKILKEKQIAIRPHPKKTSQRLLLFERRGYIGVVPFVTDEQEIFLKTLFQDRRFTKLYQRGELP